MLKAECWQWESIWWHRWSTAFQVNSWVIAISSITRHVIYAWLETNPKVTVKILPVSLLDVTVLVWNTLADTHNTGDLEEQIQSLSLNVRFALKQKEGGAECSYSTDLFLVGCHPHWCSRLARSVADRVKPTGRPLPIQPEGECLAMHVTLPRLPLRQRRTGF